uniref:Uncharacterized protein n=1 Tax=Romanomermis culicivorax TaxID=13658 RepID=A0A915I7N4_ROMCU
MFLGPTEHYLQINRVAVPGNRTRHFNQLIESAEFALITSRNQLVDIVSNPSTPQSSGLAKALQKQINCTDNRLHVLRKMLNHFKKLDVPSRPQNVQLQVGSSNSIAVEFSENPENPIVTKYKSWRDVSSKQPIDTQNLHSKLFKLQDEIETIKASDDWESLLCCREYDDKKKKSTLMPFFQAPRLQRSLRRGLYLATIFYNEVKVLLTNEDCLPIVQVDESPPFNFSTEFLWFFKLSYAWGELKFLSVVESQRMQHSSVFLRSKMIDASTAMQDILETRDLGHLHFEPIVYKEQEIVILVTAMNLKWVGMDKIFRRCSGSLGRENDLMALLSNSLLDCLNFYESSMVPLDKGLYCGYLKLHSSLNQINILVPENLPNVVPFVKIRRISHVTREEWECVKNLRELPASTKKKHNNVKSFINSNNQRREFQESLTTAIDFLLSSLGLVVQKSGSFSIYDSEIIAVNPNVNFIMILPPASEFCTGPGQQKISSEKRSNCMSLPISIFEIVNFYSYNPQFLALYCRLSTFVEYFTFILQQIYRQAYLAATGEKQCGQHTFLRLSKIAARSHPYPEKNFAGRYPQLHCCLVRFMDSQ